MGSFARIARRAAIVAAGALAARAASTAISRSPVSSRLERVNHRGGTVSLREGPAAAIGASSGAVLGARRPAHAAAAITAGLGSGAVGLYDDLADSWPSGSGAKGLKGHMQALIGGRITSGSVKLVGVSLTGLAAASMLDAPKTCATGKGRTVTHTLLGAGVIAGCANLMNLFDLRPGRALKVTTMACGPLSGRGDSAGGVAAGTLGAANALFPEDLNEETMLGDCGANALGALMGVSLAARGGTLSRAATLTAITAMTLASEKVSFTKIIADTPVLRDLDALGRPRAR